MAASAVLRDPDGTLDLEAVRRLDAQGAFQPLRGLYGAGYLADVHWLRLRFTQPAGAPARWWLQLGPPYLDDIRLHLVGPDGVAQPARHAGDRVGGAAAFEQRQATFALQLAPGTHVAYLRVQTTSSLSLLPALLPDALAAHAWAREYLVLGMSLSAGVAMVLAALFGALALRERVYALFAAFAACSFVQWLTVSGLMQQFVLHDAPRAADTLTSCMVGLASLAGTLFFAELFDYRRHHRRLLVVLHASAAYMAAAAAAPFFGAFALMAPGTGALLLLNIALMAAPLRRLWREGGADVRMAVLAFVLWSAPLLLNLAGLLGLVRPFDYALEAAQYANLLLLFVLLLAIVLRARRAEGHHRQAEQAAAQALGDYERERLVREEQGHLMTMIAHEIRTPVAVIDAALQSLRVLDEHPTPERAQRHERIERAVVRMSTLMELALAQDRLEVSRWQQAPMPLAPAALTQEVVAFIGGTAAQRVHIEAAPGLCEVQADARMVRFALLNLIDNALKYSPRSAPVTVAVAPLVHAARAGCCWRITDQGRGIAPGDAERVFQKYFRAAEVADSPGLGLGLYLVRQIVERHQGWVRAVPQAAGACFECWLPCRQQDEGAVP